MSAPVSFVDTSILCNLLPVPGRDQHREDVAKELQAKQQAGEVLVLPITAVVETGNFIGQIANGAARRRTAETFDAVLRAVLAGQAPWQIHQFPWDADFLRRFLDGAGTGSTMIQHAVNGVGGGDLCILAERDAYQRRTGIRAVGIWTRDAGLGAHA
jgi:hypothetical protein